VGFKLVSVGYTTPNQCRHRRRLNRCRRRRRRHYPRRHCGCHRRIVGGLSVAIAVAIAVTVVVVNVNVNVVVVVASPSSSPSLSPSPSVVSRPSWVFRRYCFDNNAAVAALVDCICARLTVFNVDLVSKTDAVYIDGGAALVSVFGSKFPSATHIKCLQHVKMISQSQVDVG